VGFLINISSYVDVLIWMRQEFFMGFVFSLKTFPGIGCLIE